VLAELDVYILLVCSVIVALELMMSELALIAL
jgi:hypothetical protein